MQIQRARSEGSGKGDALGRPAEDVGLGPLRESERRFRALADSMPQLVWTANAVGMVDYYNARAREYGGIAPRPDGTWSWQPVLHPDDLERTSAAWNEAIATGSEYACEHRMQMADGSYRWHLSRARLVRGQDGAEDKWFGTATDIHDRRGAEEELQRVIVARDRVVSLVSHDLRDPLGVLRTALSLLRAMPPGSAAPERTDDVLWRMDRQIVKMERLLDELLDVAKLQSGQPLTLHRRPADIVALARELVREHARSAPRHRIELRAARPEITGTWDADRLERVIGNLLSNAIKYSAAGGVVLVEIEGLPEEDPEWVELRVTDGGVGIPEQDRHRVFEWFARGGNVANTVRGTGLGLAGARQIVDAHGGTIAVQSQEGLGSTFIVRLPTRASLPPRTREAVHAVASEPAPARGRQLATAIGAAEARFRGTFQSAAVGIAHVDLDGRWLAVNPALARITGYDVDELRTKTFADVTHPDDREADWAQARRLLSGEIPSYTMEKRYVRKDGSTAWVSLTASLGHDVTTGRPYFIAIVEDIEARKRGERERREVLELVEHSPDFIATTDLDGRLTYLNAGGRTMLGLSPEADVTALRSTDYVPERWQGYFRDTVLGTARERGMWEGEMQLRNLATGELVDVFRSTILLRDPETGEPWCYGTITRDVSTIKRTEAALRESEARARALADNMSQLAWMADETGAVQWFNQRWYEHTGSTFEEARGWGWRAFIHPDHVDRVLEKLRRHVASGEPWEDTFPLRRRDGEHRWFLSYARPIRDEPGAAVRWFGTSTDVTVQREAEEALREADRRKDEFLAILAHELRNPLAPVRTAAHILRTIEPADPTLERTRAVIDRQITHMSRLIDDLVDVSRISRGKLQLQREVCDLAEIARQTTEDHRATLEASGLTVTVVDAGAALPVDGDPVRLAQMIGNLLHNAGRFSKHGGRVEVRIGADAAHRRATIAVADTGVGMDAELLSRLFDPFSQADQGLARTKGGLGLGLALTKGIAELHGGDVAAHSDGPGRGTTFTLRIPLCAGVG